MSLRARLLLGAVLIAVVLGSAGLLVIRATRAQLLDQVDSQLRTAAVQVSVRPSPTDPDDRADPLTTLYVGLLSSDGDLITDVRPNLSGDDPPLPLLDEAAVADLRAGEAVSVPSTEAGTDYRVLSRGDTRGGASLVVGLPLDDVDETVRRLGVLVAAAVGAVLVVLAIVGAWVIHLGVRPVQRMTETAQAIAGGDLSRRVPEGEPGTEAGELGEALNGMLGRIEEAFDQRAASEVRLRQFVADASHELRTPVTTIRGYAELYRAGALRQPGELDEAMRRTEQEAVRMGSLVDDLLHLARLDQGRPLAQEPVDLADLARDAVADALAVAPARAITLDAAPTMVRGDELRLRQVAGNLLTNALVHAPGAAISVRVATEGGTAVLEVVDDGPGMAEEDARRAMERFYRADVARTRHQGGSGLGLSIVEATVRAHGGDVALRAAPGEGTTVRITLPLLHEP